MCSWNELVWVVQVTYVFKQILVVLKTLRQYGRCHLFWVAVWHIRAGLFLSVFHRCCSSVWSWWSQELGRCKQGAVCTLCVCLNLGYTWAAAPVTCGSEGTDCSCYTAALNWAGPKEWCCACSYLCETQQAQRAVYAAVTSVKYNLVVTDRARWLLEANYSTSGPTLWNLGELLVP